jgi:hypothetical protein
MCKSEWLLCVPATLTVTNSTFGPCHGSGRWSSASHRGGPGSRPGQSMWDLWCTKWHWDRFFSEFSGFSLSVSFHRHSPNSYHLGNALYANVSRHPRLGIRPTPPSGKNSTYCICGFSVILSVNRDYFLEQRFQIDVCNGYGLCCL